MTPFIAEFFGTFFLILFGLGTNANVSLDKTYGHNSGWVSVFLGWGIGVFVGVSVAAPFSGAHINPAVTVGLAIANLFEWGEVLPFIIAQLLGAGMGALVVWLVFKKHFEATEDANTKMGIFVTGGAIRNFATNFFCEMMGTFVLMFSILHFSAPSFNLDIITNGVVGLGSIGALPVALLVMGIGASLGGATGFAINPARDFMPRLMHTILPIKGKRDSDWAYSWIPIVAPLLGAIIASVVYMFTKV